MPIRDRLVAFVQAESVRFRDGRDIDFAFAWAEVGRYRTYLSLTLEDHLAAAAAHRRIIDMVEARLHAPEGRGLTADELRIYGQMSVSSLRVQMTLEAVYLFTSVLLDRTATAIRLTFLPARAVKLDSHSKLTKNLDAYVNALDLRCPQELHAVAIALEDEEAWFRDKRLVHPYDRRVFHGVGRTLDSDEMVLSAGLLLPRSDAELLPGPSKTPTEIIDRVDEYLGLGIDLLEQNRHKFWLARRGH